MHTLIYFCAWIFIEMSVISVYKLIEMLWCVYQTSTTPTLFMNTIYKLLLDKFIDLCNNRSEALCSI